MWPTTMLTLPNEAFRPVVEDEERNFLLQGLRGFFTGGAGVAAPKHSNL